MPASPLLTICFSIIVAVVAIALSLGVWRSSGRESPKSARLFTLGLGAWLLATAALAYAGVLADF